MSNYLPTKFTVKIPTNPKNFQKLKDRLTELGLSPILCFLAGESYYKYVVYDSRFIFANRLWRGVKLITLDDFLTKEFPIVEIGNFAGYQVNQNRDTGDISIGCQTISAANLKKIFSSLNKKTILCDLFEDKNTIVTIVPEKNIVFIYVDREAQTFYIEDIAELKSLIK